jgi:hypothetical protein
VFDSFKAPAAWPSSLATPPLSALEARDTVPFLAGATRPARDSVDVCVIQHYCHQSADPPCVAFCAATGGCPTPGGFIESPADGCGPWPDLSGGAPLPDSDHDGMPDGWEDGWSFDPDDPSDGPQDADGDGYTNVEEYLNETDPRDSDGDGIGDAFDNCVLIPNPGQEDRDGDTHGDACDCAPLDPALHDEPPGEATGLRLDRLAFRWEFDLASATRFDLVRGLAGDLQRDGGIARAACLASGEDVTGLSGAMDPERPGPGASFYYLVRAQNVCGSGGYGSDSAGAGRGTPAPGDCD